jgi:hypothetical protein
MAGQALSVGGRVAERPVALSPASPSERLMDFAWESICNFGSLRERDCFLAWMRGQIADGVAEEIEAPAGFVLANDGSGIFLLARFGVSCRQKTYTGRLLACSRQGRLRQGPPQLATSQRSRITPTVILSQLKSGRTSAPACRMLRRRSDPRRRTTEHHRASDPR